MAYQAVAHRRGDHVAVAVQELSSGQKVQVHFLDRSSSQSLEMQEAVSLGHKFALQDLPAGSKVVEYGEIIGTAAAGIAKGSLVHVHNLKSLRW